MASNTRFDAVDISRVPGAGSSSLSSDDVIDLAGINSGEQPASIVIVPYIDKKLEAYEPDEAKWEEVESVGDPESVTLQSTMVPSPLRTRQRLKPSLNMASRLI